MNKAVLGLILGGILGVFDGCTALLSGPELFEGDDGHEKLLLIILGSTFKGLVAGLVTGFVARKLRSLPLGLLVGLAAGALCALPFALGEDPDTHKVYFWEIMIPGAICGAIVGFATQKYGVAPPPRTSANA